MRRRLSMAGREYCGGWCVGLWELGVLEGVFSEKGWVREESVFFVDARRWCGGCLYGV